MEAWLVVILLFAGGVIGWIGGYVYGQIRGIHEGVFGMINCLKSADRECGSSPGK